MTADGTPGAKNQPQFLGTGAPATAADMNVIADYAALVGNRKSLTSAERLALTGSERWDGLEVFDKTDGRTYRWMSGGWDNVGVRMLGRNRRTSSVTLALSPSWTDVCTVSATSRGGEVHIVWSARLTNLNSGGNRDGGFQVVLDGVPVPDSDFAISVQAIGTGGTFAAAFDAVSTPAAGAHTWKLQGNASTAVAVGCDRASMTVTEH